MRYVRTTILLFGIVVAYYLMTTLLHLEAAAGDTSRMILFTVLVFVWRLTTNPNKKYFS